MAHWLPQHRDNYFLAMQAAMRGAYQPQGEAPDPEDEFDRQMAELHRKAAPLLQKLRPNR
jgi:hypothetical protein